MSFFKTVFKKSEKDDFMEKMNEDGTVAVDPDKVLREHDKESAFRKLSGYWLILVKIISVLFVSYQLITARFGTPIHMKHLLIHLGFILVLIWLYYPATKKSNQTKPTIMDIGLIILTLVTVVFMVMNHEAFVARRGIATTADIVFGAIIALMVIEGTRRVVGKGLVILIMIFLAYALFGNFVPGILAHRGYSLTRVIYSMSLTGGGIFGVPLDVSAGYLIIFIILAALLDKSGLGKLFNDISCAIGGRMVGGPAKVAVISSALAGTIQGSAATNVATTGAFTIPLMKKLGYKAHFAGAVEAAASTGGQIMPPIMGTVAFIMAEYLGVSYITIAAAAVIPAMLYFSGVFFQIDLRSRKMGLKGMDKEDIPDAIDTIKKYGHMILSLVLLVYLLLVGFSPSYAGFYAVVSTWILSLVRKESRLGPKGLVDMAVRASRSALSIAIALAAAGFVVAVLSMTGIGVILADNIVFLSRGILFIALLLTMVVSIILGMGLPTSACYIIAATIAVPILRAMEVDAFQAHFFVLYFAVVSTITPPVALSSYVAAGMSGGNVTQVSLAAFRLAIAAFIIPFFFIYNPAMLLIADSNWIILWAAVTALVGTYLLSAGIEGYLMVDLPWWTRIVSIGAALTFMYPGTMSDIAGAVLLAIMALYIFRAKKKAPSIKDNTTVSA